MAVNSDLMRGVAEPIILKLLAEKMMYGYEIIREVNARTGGAFAWKEGSLYPCLHKLESKGLIASSWRLESGKPRRYYAITVEGEKAMAEKVAELKTFAGALTMLIANA